jgi:hypothetical protein
MVYLDHGDNNRQEAFEWKASDTRGRCRDVMSAVAALFEGLAK